mmetsp:Transcript_59985/g.141465  ORF Transcript_59985/g.141465 Transcript_59985/m.141465 type:complete len:230 (-) Transcript_59985:525-1214(-)
MGHEDSRELGLNDSIQIAGQNPHFDQPVGDDFLRELMHVHIGRPRLDRRHNLVFRLEHRRVQGALIRRELAVDRERARDVGGIAVVLGAHVVEHEVSVLHLPTVRRSCVSVVEHRGIGSGASDGRVGSVAHPTVHVAVVQEYSLELILHHPWLAPAHDLGVRSARDLVRKAQDLDLGSAFYDARLVQPAMQHVGLQRVGVRPLEARRLAWVSAVRVLAAVDVDQLWRSL